MRHARFQQQELAGFKLTCFAVQRKGQLAGHHLDCNLATGGVFRQTLACLERKENMPGRAGAGNYLNTRRFVIELSQLV